MATLQAFDVQEETERLISDAPPAHYLVKIQSFSQLAKNGVDKYESDIFLAGGYEWKLILHPNGNKTKNVKDHVSVYLSMAETSSLPSSWEVYAVIRLFLLDQNKDNYLIVQDAMGKDRRFHRMKLESGFDQLIPLKTFTDSLNGYLVDDTCVLGAEVFVSKERSMGKGESLVMIKDALSNKHRWKIDNFSNLDKEYYDSSIFPAGNYKWNIRFFPNGKGSGLRSYISLYLDLAETGSLPPGTKVFAEFSLRILNQAGGSDFISKANYWFSASSRETGWARFVSLWSFKRHGLVKDSCLVEAEVSVLGMVNHFTVSDLPAMATLQAFDEQEGTERLISNAPPAHYLVKIQSFSLLTKNGVDKYESGIFHAGGYKWKMILHPNGNKTKNVKDHVSVYLSMAETSSLPSSWEVYAVIRLFLLDQNKDNYFIVQDAMGKHRRFHRMKLESGFDQLIPLKTFTDSRNGYLEDDTCVLGAEVFVSKERSTGKGENLVMIKDALSNQHYWMINNFSKLDKEYYISSILLAGNYKWNIRFFPNGKGSGLGSYISLYLYLAETESLPLGTKVFAGFSLRILNNAGGSDFISKANHWFSASSRETGWARFVPLWSFKNQGLSKDSCWVTAEVSVLGVVNPFT
ncbi:uncharacterized protein LOC116203472 [Punica granatum]|uniref:Uncharacterized protein LOC116203472 n=1 Tax=Punica granatum TaxID=22663 RepID=A0A6P8DC56_PUNGR|nr:uncharacterized protein LOC116203472 [Punica granatum]